jgi:DNA-binding GntR family transcriptional regulator
MARTADKVYDLIRHDILDGSYEAGHHLKEEVLAESIGVSRTPIREALRQLHADGLVDFIANQGTFVANWAADDLDEIFGLRALLEGYGCHLAARRISDDDLDRLDCLANQMLELYRSQGEAATDQIARLNNEFHQLILKASGNRRLTSMISHIVAVPLVHRTFHRYDSAALQRSLTHHGELVTALRWRDPAWASSVMRAHILAARRSLRATSNDTPDPFGIAIESDPDFVED